MKLGESKMKAEVRRDTSIGFFTLFASSSTLICCALPIILVTLGMGASVAAMTSSFPFLIVLSQYKIWVFAISGFMLVLSAWLSYRPGQSCPSDDELARICALSKLWNKRILWVSIIIWNIGFFAAFLALPLTMALNI
jgi:mercuric ion transport protein